MKTDSKNPTDIIVPLGQALKDARIAASLSIEEVAEQLNFSPSAIRDFEDNLTQILETQKYPVIYLRGYLSNYAKLVGLNTLELFVEYQQLAVQQKKVKKLTPSDLIIPKTNKRSKKWPLGILFLSIAIVVIYLSTTQLFTSAEQTQPVSDPIAEQLVSQDNDLTNTKDNEEATVEVQVTPPDSAATESLKAPETTPQATDNIAQPQSETSSSTISAAVETKTTQVEEVVQAKDEHLSLAFNADCWTEVFDATGKRIAFGLYKNGRVLSLTGVAPFQLKLGNPSVVDIQYQNQVIKGEFTPGRTARFSVPLS